MRLAYLSASTAALLLSSTALMAQDATASGGATGAMDFTQSVFIDVEGSAYLVPIDVAAELCAIEAAELTQTAQANFEASGMDPAMMQGTGTDTAAAGAAGTTGTETGTAATDTATADAGATAATDAGAADTAATDTATADAGGTTGTEAGNVGAAGMGSDTATADASAATGEASGEVQNVETTAADATAGATGGQSFTAAGPEFVELVVCQVDMATATAGGNTFSPAGDAGSTN